MKEAVPKKEAALPPPLNFVTVQMAGKPQRRIGRTRGEANCAHVFVSQDTIVLREFREIEVPFARQLFWC